MVLSATTASKNPKENLDFFPLTVDVEERMYAAGRIPGSFFRREGRPSEDAILTCRLIDRPLRPSFVKGLRNEIQVVVTILRSTPAPVRRGGDQRRVDVHPAGGLPFSGPIGGVRVALIKGQWVAFPTVEQLERAMFDMVVAGRLHDGDVAIMMVEAESTGDVIKLVEGGAEAPTEDTVAEGLEAAKPFIAALCTAQQRLADKAAEPPASTRCSSTTARTCTRRWPGGLRRAGPRADHRRQARARPATEELKAEFARLADSRGPGEGDQRRVPLADQEAGPGADHRRRLPHRRPRPDRHPAAVRRGRTCCPGCTASALFERGETQILGVTTLNMLRMEQMIDTLNPERTKRYMHNYNFPPYSTGETGRVGSPKRREIGHGALAERALIPVLPTREEFPYAIRQVSEAIGSNGSTSMGSVCASTMALLDAGVPLKDMVSGIAMGLIHRGRAVRRR